MAVLQVLGVLDGDRFNVLRRWQLELEYLGVEAQFGIKCAADVLRAPEAVLLAVESR